MQAGFTDIGTLPQSERRDFRGVSHDEAMRRALDIAGSAFGGAALGGRYAHPTL